VPALIQSDVTIKASASRVWDLLANLERYPEWNPLVTEASGELRRGQFLDLVIAVPDQSPYELHSKVLEAEALSRITVRCSLATDHSIVLEPTATGVHVVQMQRFDKSSADALNGEIGGRIQLGIEMMNAALKARAER
jgi:uncharacterized protein YndB with AHSA1/START domain